MPFSYIPPYGDRRKARPLGDAEVDKLPGGVERVKKDEAGVLTTEARSLDRASKGLEGQVPR
jgi:hypothetical protein